MAPRKWIDRNTATTYKLVHRPQNDPLIHDQGASSMVFQELLPPQASKKGLTLSDLGSDYRSQASDAQSSISLRDNEGEAAEYGVYYDDTEYDYMQHLRDLGNPGDASATFIEATPVTVKTKGQKGKAKEKGVSLDEALRTLDLEHERSEMEKVGKLVDESILPSRNYRVLSYQDQQDVPDALAGFQPDMDPRLREALEALEDEEYVDNEDQGLFDMLAEGGEEIEEADFEDEWWEDEEGYESDDTARPINKERDIDEVNVEEDEMPANTSDAVESETTMPPSDAAIPDAPADPFAAFNAHKANAKSSQQPTPSNASAIRDSRMHAGAAASTIMSSASFLTKAGGKKRKGALTNPSAYSMTSSALQRTEGQTLLDARFDKVLETQYEEEEDMDDLDAETSSVATGMTGNASVVSGMSAASGLSRASSQAPDLVRYDYSSVMGVMDDFLGTHGGGPAEQGDSRAATQKRGKGGKTRRGYGGQTGMQQLDEIRKELGRPKVKMSAVR